MTDRAAADLVLLVVWILWQFFCSDRRHRNYGAWSPGRTPPPGYRARISLDFPAILIDRRLARTYSASHQNAGAYIPHPDRAKLWRLSV
jgi:hypothetical protein